MGNIRKIFREVAPEAMDFSFYFDDDGIKEAGGDCRPWNMRAVVKSYDFPPAYSVEDLDAAENRCLDMGGPMPD